MDSVLNSMVVTAIFLVAAIVVGRRLERTTKPYGSAILITHITLFVLIAGGVIASIYKLSGVTEGKFLSTISLYVAALTLLGNLTIGTTMAIARRKYGKLIVAHKLSTSLMAISILSGIAFMALRV
jgi:hypothetical protein